MDAADLLLAEVRELVRARGIDPLKDTSALEQLVTDAEDDYLRRSDAGLVPPLIDPAGARSHVLDSMAGLGPLQSYLDDESIEEIWVNAPGRVFIARSGRPELTTTILESEDLAVLVERMLRASGRRLDLSSPFVDAQLAGGQRLHVVIPPITSQHWAVNIRKHTSRASRTADLVRMGSLTSQVAAFLDASVQAGLNILVSGATQAGKTTMVRALAGAIPGAQRVISCEEVFELALRNRDCVAMQTRPPNLEGVGEISLRRLVKEALRMRPDRLLIGEVREAEALDLLIAMNSGFPADEATYQVRSWSSRTQPRGSRHTPTEPPMPLGGAIVARTTARATGELALRKRTGYTSWANVAERGRGQAGRFGRGDAPGESGPQGPPATTHTGATPTPQPRRPHRAPRPRYCRGHPTATEHPGRRNPRVAAPPFNGGHRALPPGHSHRLPCSRAGLPGCMGEALSQA